METLGKMDSHYTFIWFLNFDAIQYLFFYLF